jgi:arachidonate 5-lipoxygenase
LYADLKSRGVTKEELPFYPYRDDATSYREALDKFVTGIVDIFYSDNDSNTATESKIQGDIELQTWCAEIHDKFATAKGKFPDVDTSTVFPQKIETREQLIFVMTNIVFTSTVQHSIMNYGLNSYYR